MAGKTLPGYLMTLALVSCTHDAVTSPSGGAVTTAAAPAPRVAPPSACGSSENWVQTAKQISVRTDAVSITVTEPSFVAVLQCPADQQQVATVAKGVAQECAGAPEPFSMPMKVEWLPVEFTASGALWNGPIEVWPKVTNSLDVPWDRKSLLFIWLVRHGSGTHHATSPITSGVLVLLAEIDGKAHSFIVSELPILPDLGATLTGIGGPSVGELPECADAYYPLRLERGHSEEPISLRSYIQRPNATAAQLLACESAATAAVTQNPREQEVLGTN